MQQLENLLAEVPFFGGLGSRELETLAGCAGNVRFTAGQNLFREGDPADTFYVVRHGSVALETFVPTRGGVMIETIEAGEVIGWSWLFEPYRWHFDARALDIVRAVAFDGACLRGKCENDHSFGFELLSRFSPVMLERLQATRLQLLDVYGSAA